MVKIVLIGHVYTLVGYSDAGILFFCRMNQDFLYNVVMARCTCTIGEMNADCCVLERDRFVGGSSVMVWAAIAFGYGSPLVVTDGDLNAHHFIPLFHNNANISIYQHENVTSDTTRDTVNFLWTNNIDFLDDWPANSPDLNPIEHV